VISKIGDSKTGGLSISIHTFN